MAHKRETVFGAKADKKEKGEAVITPLTDKDLKT